MKKVVTERKKKIIIGISIVLIVFCLGVYLTHLYNKQNVQYSHYEEPKVLEENQESYTSGQILDSEIYTIESGYISKISPLTTLDDLKNNLDETNITVYKKDGTTSLQANELVGTGMKLVCGGSEYKLAVLGDINGDGKVGITDITQMNLANVGLRPSLVDEYKKAGDINANGSITITDVTRVNLAVVDLIDIIAPNTFIPEVVSTKDTITVSGSTIDTNSGIKGYWFEINYNGWVQNTDITNNEYTFTNLQNETEYTVRMKVVDNEGNTKITKRVEISTLNTENANISIVASPTEWTNQNVLVAVNYNSNVAKETKQVSIDNGTTWVEYTEPLKLEKNTTIKARVTNSSGKVLEEVAKEITNIDKLAPNEFNITIATTSNTVTINAETTDQAKTNENGCSGIKEYRYILNDGMWNVIETTEENSHTFMNLTSGKQYAVQVIAIDNAGNETEGTYIETDTEGPIIAVTGNATEWTNQDVVLSLEVTDEKSSIASLTINGEEQTLREGKCTYTVTQNEQYEIIAVDTKGNITTENVVVDKIDKTAPTITFSKESNSTELSTQEVGVTVVEEESGKGVYKYVWLESEESPTDEASYVDGEFEESSTITRRGLSGEYYLHVYMKDNAGNETIAKTEGTFKFKYTISNEEELIQFNIDLETNNFEGKTVYLIDNVQCTEDISYDKLFKGTFEGGNHTISNITSTLFKSNYGTIKDLGIVDANISGSDEDLGGIIGYNYGTVENCWFKGELNYTGSVAGGVAGIAISNGSKYNTTAKITNCYVVENSKILASNIKSASGIVLENYATVERCYNAATVTSDSSSTGICRMNAGTIKECYNTGNITGDHTAAGITGYTDENLVSEVKNCYNTGNITSEGSASGIVSSVETLGKVKNCYNTGVIAGDHHIAGIVSSNYGSIANTYNLGEVKVQTFLGGFQYIGGICGWLYDGSIYNSYNSGNVAESVDGSKMYGGICGRCNLDTAQLSQCYYLKGTSDVAYGKASFALRRYYRTSSKGRCIRTSNINNNDANCIICNKWR